MSAPIIHKVRRIAFGSKRAEGRELQKRRRRVQRRTPGSVKRGTCDPNLTGMAGLLDFDRFLHAIDMPQTLRRCFDSMKTGSSVVYPMSFQLHLLLTALVVGAERVFDLEASCHDALFVHLAGGHLPSIDVLYRDLERFGPPQLAILSRIATAQCLRALTKGMREVIVDVDTTVEPLFGNQQGVLPGYNPKYHGRPCYHPIVARIAELDMVLAAELRPGDRGFGAEDAPTIAKWVQLVRDKVGPRTLIRVRIDAAADCGELLSALEQQGVLFITKARMTQDLCDAVALHNKWRTVEHDAMDRITRQVATIDFERQTWYPQLRKYRVITVREIDRHSGKQVFLWPHLDFEVQVYITNDHDRDETDLVEHYNDRAGIEPLFAELKQSWTIGKVPSRDFNANSAMLLLKVMAFNLLRRFVRECHPTLYSARWRASWIRRVLILRPGRLVRSGRQVTLRHQPMPHALQ